jgi:flagellar biosynthesis/type III secretory pathway protein FliH
MRLRVNYKISIDDELSDELERINMSMGSELREALMEDMREEAYEKIYEEAREKVYEEVYEKAYEEAYEKLYEEAREKAYEEAREQIRREGREKTVQFMIKVLCNTNSSDESVESILKDVDPDIAEEVKRRLQQNKDESN